MADKKHVLFLTWKDIRHPHTGWSEVVLYKYAKGLVDKGYKVTWFASAIKGRNATEVIDGIEIIRKYTQNTVWMLGWWWYRGYRKNHSVDIIFDEAGGWPLLSPLFEHTTPIIFLANHLGEKEFVTRFPPIGWIVKWFYYAFFRLYRNIQTVTISQSTKDELIEKIDFKAENIEINDIVTDVVPIKEIDWENKTNNILFLGRLTSIKRVDHAIRAFASVAGRLPTDTKLSIIGNSQETVYVAWLRALARELGVEDRVVFHGYLARGVFESTIASHRLVLVPSEKEGFGLVVQDANAYGLPAIAYDVAWLRDSVLPGTNGVLVPNGDFTAMGEQIVELFDDAKYTPLAQSSLKHVQSLGGWQPSIDRLDEIISETLSTH